MSNPPSLPGSPGTAPLQVLTPDRVNQRDAIPGSPIRSDSPRDSSVFEKISQFNNMATTVSMSKQLERKTADAALKRAMLGREEAESEMRRYREDVRSLRKQVEEGRERERKVGERLETVMENYGRAKETFSHTQAIWEKEIRRARKETFKGQSSIVKLQEDLKASKLAWTSTEEVLEREKERSQAREQEAFAARYQLVGVQEQLAQALERVKAIEQERDAFKTLAKNEEVARIAAEGRLPLPDCEEDDEFASPKKKTRVSLTAVDIRSSATSEAEIDELTRLWQWEKQRADRTQEHLEFLEVECELDCCACAKTRSRRSMAMRKARPESVTIVDAADLAILGQDAPSADLPPTPTEDTVLHNSPARELAPDSEAQEPAGKELVLPKERRSTIFVPSEGIFRTLSQQEMEAMEVDEEPEAKTESPTPVEANGEPFHYARTPSVDPPSFAVMAQQRTSLLSLLNAPHGNEVQSMAMAIANIPTTPAAQTAPQPEMDESEDPAHETVSCTSSPEPPATDARPHTSAAFYKERITTTTVPVRDDENADPAQPPSKAFASQGRAPSFDVNNPALTPTMTREQALAQIKERRGRARSAAQGAMTPRKQMVSGALERRDVSAPVGRGVKAGASRN